MINKYMTCCCVLLICVWGEASPAGTVIYDEAVSGDLPSGLISDPIITLDFGIGTNTIRAQRNYEYRVTGEYTNDDDAFIFTIPDGTQLESIELFLFNVAISPETDILEIANDLIPTEGSANHHQHIAMHASPPARQLLYEGDYPIEGDSWFYFTYFARVSTSVPSEGSWDYELSFTVGPTPVPIPAGLWLLGSSLAMLPVLRRRGV